ncbi:rRNA processing protein [Tilletia horrida]|nr:rRNA processing protein [Tilletia horrida]
MPKSAKHKAQRAADFQKTKLKLGSGKGKAATAKTATDTSFKARTIALPQQSITADKSQAIVTRRNLTLDDLLGQSRHYNAATRKDALFGLREILSLHPFLLHKPGVLPAVLAASLRLIPDEDPTVRKAVHTFLSFLLPALHSQQHQEDGNEHARETSLAALSHYAPSLILYTVSALSHIFTEVRIDALRVLDLLLDHIPTAVAAGWDGLAPAFRLGSASGADGFASSSAGMGRRGAESTGQQVITCLLTILGIPDLGTFAQQQVEQGRANSGSSSALSGVSTATANLPASARLLLFQIIGKFLSASDRTSGGRKGGITAEIAEQDIACPTWFMRFAFASTSDREAFEHFLSHPAGGGTGSAARGHDDMDTEEEQGLNGRVFAVSSAAYLREGDSLLDVGSSGPPAWSSINLQAALASAPDLLNAFSELDGELEEHGQGKRGVAVDHARQASASAAAPVPSRYSILASALAPVFLNSLLDSAPTLFSPDIVLNAAVPAASSGPDAVTGLNLHGLLLRAIIQATLKLWRSLAAALADSVAASSSGPQRRRKSKQMSHAQLSELSTFLAKLAPYFPFSEHIPGARTRSPQEAEQITEMELGYAELVALCMFCLRTAEGDDGEGADEKEGAKRDKKKLAASAKKGKRKASMREMLLHQLEDVGEYIVETLLGQRQQDASAAATVAVGKGTGGSAIAPPLPASTFTQLLPTIWLLLNLDEAATGRGASSDSDSSDDDEDGSNGGYGKGNAAGMRTRLVEALIAYFGKATRGKAVVFEFLARLSILHTYPSYSASFSPLEHPPMLAAFRTWFQSLPRALWDAATKKDARLADAILEYLRTVCAADDGEILSHEDIDALHSPLAVFFHLQHPTRGSMAGPYARLPEGAQARARALLFYLQPLDRKLSSAAGEAGAL